MEEDKREKIKNLLLSAWKDACEQMKISPDNQQPMYTYVIDERGTVGFKVAQKGISCIDQIVEIVSKDQIIGKRFSRKEL